MQRIAYLHRLFFPLALLCFCFQTSSVEGQNVFQRLRERMREQIEQSNRNPALQPPPGPERPGGLPSSVPPLSTNPANNAVAFGITAAEQGLRPPFRVLVMSVNPGTVAEQVGLRPGDVVLELDGTKIQALRDIASVVGNKKPGEALVVRFVRNRRTLQATAIIPEVPTVSQDLPNSTTGGVPPLTPRKILEKTQPGSGRLGIIVENAATTPPGPGVPVQRGAVVVEVNADSPAAALGLKKGDVVVAIDGVLIADAAALVKYISQTQPGQRIEVSFYQGRSLMREALELADAITGPGGIIPSRVLPGNIGNESDSSGITPTVLGAVGDALGGLFAESPDTVREIPDAVPEVPVEPQTPPDNLLEPAAGGSAPDMQGAFGPADALPPPSIPLPPEAEANDSTPRELELRAEIETLRAQVKALQAKIQQLESRLKSPPQ